MTTSSSNSTVNLTTNSASNGVVVVLEPYVIHIINSVVQHLTFLHQQGYIEKDVLDEIGRKLPKPVLQKNKNTITSPTSPVAAPQSPASQSSAPSPKTTNSIVDSPVLEERGESTNGDLRSPLSDQTTQHEINLRLSQVELKNPSSQSSLTNSTEGSNTPLTRSSRPYTYTTYEQLNITEKPNPPRPQSYAAIANAINQGEEIGQHQHHPYTPLAIVEALWNFSGDVDDLAFQKGDKIEVTEFVNDEWWHGNIQGQFYHGIFPRVYTKILSQVNSIPSDHVMNNSSNRNTLTYYPPPPQPLNTQAPPQPQKPKQCKQPQSPHPHQPQKQQAIKSTQYQTPMTRPTSYAYPNHSTQPFPQNAPRPNIKIRTRPNLNN